MLHPDTQLRFISPQIGYGVFATKAIPAGTILWMRDPLDRVFTADEYAALSEMFGDAMTRFTWPDGSGVRTLCWDFARYMNHSCSANSLSPGGFPLELAVHDIEAGAQLTSEYGALNLEAPFVCACSSVDCRGEIRPEDFLTLAPEWDKKLQAAMPRLLTVAQPLWRFVASYESELREYAMTPSKTPSILKNRWEGAS